MQRMEALKPALLGVVPPYTTLEPPAGLAYLLGYAKKSGCDDFGFLDLRLGLGGVHTPTYTHTGLFGECYVMDVPDLPLVLRLLANFDEGNDLLDGFSTTLDRYCRERGMSAPFLEQYLQSIHRYLRDAAAQIAGVRFVGLSTWTSNFLTSLIFAGHLKRLPKPPTIVLGGPQVTESRSSASLAVKSRLIDVACFGEGEATLMDVYANVDASGALRNAPFAGTATIQDNGDVAIGAKRPLLKTEEIPVPAYDQMPLLSYQDAGESTLPFHLSRGCTDRCVFCSEWKFWERFRPGDANETIEGIKQLHQQYGPKFIAFTDSLLNGHPARLRQFAEGIVSEGINVRWNGFMRANMDVETARLLKRAGCDSVFIGVESMSDETLALMKKRRTEAHNVSAMHAFLDAGIKVIAGVIPGFPNDARDAFIHTSDRLRGLQRTYKGMLRVNAEPFVISPGQPMYASLEEHGLKGVRWDESVLDEAPRYRDLAQDMFCTVEGACQGIERIGRLRIAEAMESDDAVRMDPFDYKGDEDLSTSEFEFEYLQRGWFLARIQGPAQWIYAVIVSEREKGKLGTELECDLWEDTPNVQRVRQRLEDIAASHLVPPSKALRLPAGGYFYGASAAYCLSPYVIARVVGSGVGRRILVANFYDQSWKMLPAWYESLIQCLSEGAQSAQSARLILERSGRSVSEERCLNVLQGLVEEGVALKARND